MVFVNLSDKIGQYSDYTLTHDHKLVVYHPVQKPFDIKDIKPEWFRCAFPGGYVCMRLCLSLNDASRLLWSHGGGVAKYIMVFTLNLKEICRTPGTTYSERSDCIVINKGRILLTIEQREGMEAALC